MRNKKIYNNLFDSICATILLFGFVSLYIFTLIFGVFNYNEDNPVGILICSTILFGGSIIFLTVMIINACYGYWILTDDSIISKKLFRKRRQIKLTEINKVEPKKVPAVVGIYNFEAYSIYSNDIRIVVVMQDRIDFSELNAELAKFITN